MAVNSSEKAQEAGRKAAENNQNLLPREQTNLSHEEYGWLVKGFNEKK